MAEITNNFLQGKMNKDLDERIIPKGQYREAMNVQISTSEGSDVGSVQNIRGTKAISSIASINSTAVCVGSIEDTLTDHIYYFVRCSDRDFIAKYDVANDYSSMLVVDLGKGVASVERFLKFSGKQITAISIVDNFLFFTDGENEPKKIDLSKIAKTYEECGISCLSILTDEKYFKGSIKDLIKIRKASKLPILRKDFIVDEYQVYESKLVGADCILIILSMLDQQKAIELEEIAQSIGLDVIIEIHNKDELERSIRMQSELIGINRKYFM